MARIIGCRDLHVATITTEGAKPTYATPVRIPSLINLSIKDSVESTSFYSDDTVEQNFSKTSSKEVEIELGYLDTETEALLTGRSYTNGMLAQTSDDTSPEIALMFRAPKSKGGAFRYMVLYKGTLSKTDSEYKTQEDKIESSTIKLSGVFIPLAGTQNLMSATLDSDVAGASAVTSAWFTAVQFPTTQASKAK